MRRIGSREISSLSATRRQVCPLQGRATMSMIWRRSSAAPKLAAGEPSAFDEGAKLGPGDIRMDLVADGRGAEAAIGRCDDVFAPYDPGITPNALGYELWMLDQGNAMRDDTLHEHLAIGNLRPLPYLPFMLMSGVRRFEGVCAGPYLEHEI